MSVWLQESEAAYLGPVKATRAVNSAPVGALAGDAFALAAAGSPVDVAPQTMPAQAGCGTIRTYFDLFYNRYHVIPTHYDAGIVTADKDTTVYVWNAFFSLKTLNSISVTADGVYANVATPRGLRALEVLPVPLHIDGTGAATLDGSVSYQFDDGSADMLVSGIRSILFDFPMNWARQFQREVAFKTDIFTARSGREQRRSLRGVPRITVTAEVLAAPDRFEDLRNALLLRQDVSAVVPEFSRRTYLSADAAAADTSLSVEEAMPWIQQGTTIVIERRSDGRMFVLSVKSVSGTSVETSSTIGADFRAGDIVYPGLAGMLGADLQLRAELSNVASLSYTLEAFPESIPVWSRSWDDSYDGRDFMNIPPNWLQAPTIGHKSTRERIDYGFGRLRMYLPREYNAVSFKATWRGLSRNDVQRLEDFFVRQKGAARAFWMPSWTKDMTLVAGFNDTESVIKVKGSGVQKFKNHRLWKALRIRLRDGQEIRRKITDIVDPGDGNSSIVLDNQLGLSAQPEDVLAIEWIYLARMLSDKMPVSFHTDTAADISLTMLALEQ